MKLSENYKKLTGKKGVFSIQSIENIPSIMNYGILSNEEAKRFQHISIALEDVQRKRDLIKIPNHNRLHQYANLYFDYWNPMLSKLRNKNDQICLLSINPEILDLHNVILSDRNAASSYANYYSVEEGLKNLNFNQIFMKNWKSSDYYLEQEQKSVKCAEILVPNVVEYKYVLAAAVFNNNAANKLKEYGFNKNIYVKPEFFFGGQSC